MNRINGTALPKNRHWTAEEERLLGTKPDRVLARKFGPTVTAIAAPRHSKHIRFLKKWNPEDDALLGVRPDAHVAMLLKRPRYQVVEQTRDEARFWINSSTKKDLIPGKLDLRTPPVKHG